MFDIPLQPIYIQNLIHPVSIARKRHPLSMQRIDTEIRTVLRPDDQDIVERCQAVFAHPDDGRASGLELPHHIISIYAAAKL